MQVKISLRDLIPGKEEV